MLKELSVFVQLSTRIQTHSNHFVKTVASIRQDWVIFRVDSSTFYPSPKKCHFCHFLQIPCLPAAPARQKQPFWKLDNVIFSGIPPLLNRFVCMVVLYDIVVMDNTKVVDNARYFATP